MRFLGPVGKVMVRRGAMQTTDVDKLYRMLAENLTNPEERSAFLAGRPQLAAAAAPSEPGTAVAAQAAGTGMTVALSAEAIEQGTKLLAGYLGPIAKVVAKKAAAQASSRRHFHMLLAESLANPAERTKFLHDVGAE